MPPLRLLTAVSAVTLCLLATGGAAGAAGGGDARACPKPGTLF